MSSLLSTGASLIALQLLSRALTFSLNQALVRLTTPQALGTATIQLEVLLNTVLFWSREGVRGALVRTAPSDGDGQGEKDAAKRKTRLQQLTNATFLPIPLGLVVSLLLYTVYYKTLPHLTQSQPHFLPSLSLYFLATILELLSEPFYLKALLQNDTRLRVRIEGAAVIGKTLTTLGVVVWMGESWGLWGFAWGQLVYGASMMAGFWWHYGRGDGGLLLPKRPGSNASDSKPATLLDKNDLALSYALTRQSLVKQFLSEGDKIIVGRVCAIEDQGGYAIALNYGSLIARILFQPIEETARLHFSKTLGSTSASPSSSHPTPPTLAPHISSARLLSLLLRFHTHLTLTFLTFGPLSSPSSSPSS